MTQAAISAALSVILGIAMGAFYDLIRFTRLVLGIDARSPFKKCGRKKFVSYILVCLGDFLFFAVLSVCMCVFFFLTGDGRMRAYGLCGAFLGFLLYYNTVGRLFIAVSSYLVSLFKKFIREVLVLFFAPFAFLFGYVKKTVLQILSLPIVMMFVKRYNDYINKCRKNAAVRARNKKMKRGGCVSNGGTHGEKIK